MAVRSWSGSDRLVHPQLLVGLEAMLTPPVHHLKSALQATFPTVKVVNFQSAVSRYNDGTAMVTVRLSYVGPPLAAANSDVARLVAALQMPVFEHVCPTRGATLRWIRCGNEECCHTCAAPDAEPGWFLLDCCGLAHFPQEVIAKLDWRCLHCAADKPRPHEA